MKTASAKQKGRLLQKWVVKKLIDYGVAEEGDVESRPMGSGGEDVIMGNNTRNNFPYSVECKNVEKLNVWQAYQQAGANAGKHEPLVVMKRNGTKPLAVVDAEHFIRLIAQNLQIEEQSASYIIEDGDDGGTK